MFVLFHGSAIVIDFDTISHCKYITGEGNYRDTEVELVLYNAVIGWKDGLQVTSNPPKMLTLLRTVVLDYIDFPSSILHHNGITYVGMSRDGRVVKFDSDYQLSEHFCASHGCVEGLAVSEDTTITIIQTSDEHTIESYKLSEQGSMERQKSWRINRGRMCVVGSEVVVLGNFRLKIYSLTGDIIRSLPCPEIGNGAPFYMCTAGEDSVVVSDDSESRILRIDINTGEVMWTSHEITDMLCVTMYDSKWLLVGRAGYDEQICVFNVDTGLFL